MPNYRVTVCGQFEFRFRYIARDINEALAFARGTLAYYFKPAFAKKFKRYLVEEIDGAIENCKLVKEGEL